jgi:hypothetical protein
MIRPAVIGLTSASPFSARGFVALVPLSQSECLAMRITFKAKNLDHWHGLVWVMQYLLVEREVVMKTALLKTITLIALTLTFVGCGNGKSKLKNTGSATTSTPIAIDPDADLTATAVWPFTVTGDTVELVPVSWEVMDNYVGLRPLNDPSNAMINLKFNSIDGLNIHSGTVRIGYTDTGVFRYGEFGAGTGKNENCKNCYNNGEYESAYNYWTTINGKRTFMAYVQDKYGSLIIVLEDALGTGDASGSSVLSGRVFYRNFAKAACPNQIGANQLQGNSCDQSPYRKCWYIYSGPYACYSSVMGAKSSSTSIDGYTLLGTFSGVQSYKVFE